MASATVVRSVTVVHNNVTLTAGAADTTAAGQAIGTKHDAVLGIKLTNGATGPTVPAQVQVQCSEDNTNYYDLGGPLKGGTANNGVYSWNIDIPPEVLYVRTVSGSNTAQNVTLRVVLMTRDSVTIV